MKKIDLGQTITILANVGVIAGIVFLVIEMRLNTAMLEAVMNQNREESAMGEAQSMYNSDYLPALKVAVDSGQDLTPVDIERLRHWLRGFNRNQDNLLRQYQQGLLTDNIPRSIRQAVRSEVAQSRITREMWENTKIVYTDEYISLVDEVLAE